MKYFIDPKVCCKDGLSIVQDKWKAWENGDHRALVQLRNIEEKHLFSCTICNPLLLVENFFGREVQVKNE